MIDLRSDTVTKPTAEMKDTMFNAPVGDDIWDDDPSVNLLQEKAADMFGMESALYCASGTMTNQIAINVHTRPGDEIICNHYSHIYNYEGGGVMFNSSCSVKLTGTYDGLMTADEVKSCINPDDIHSPRTRMVEVENTANKGGGTCYNFDELLRIEKIARDHKLAYHLDGARLFNALVEKNETPKQYGELFDSISICLSKGLGCPIGSLILGDHDFIMEAKRVRKKFGGGWRQAGYMAAAGIYALDHHVDRLADDHSGAKKIFEVLKSKNWVEKVVEPQTNILIFHVKDGDKILNKFLENGIAIVAMAPNMLRIVTHLDVSEADIDQVCQIISEME